MCGHKKPFSVCSPKRPPKNWQVRRYLKYQDIKKQLGYSKTYVGFSPKTPSQLHIYSSSTRRGSTAPSTWRPLFSFQTPTNTRTKSQERTGPVYIVPLLNSEVRSPFNRNIYNELQKYIAHGISLAVFL